MLLLRHFFPPGVTFKQIVSGLKRKREDNLTTFCWPKTGEVSSTFQSSRDNFRLPFLLKHKINPRRLPSTRLVSGRVKRKQYLNDKMECPKRSLRKVGDCVVSRAFETQLGKPCTRWSAFIVCHSLQRGSDQRPPGIPSHLYHCVLILWIHLS